MSNVIGEDVRKNILRLITELANGSQNGLAKKCGIRQSTMNGICNGRSDASLGTIERIAAAYDLLPWQLMVPGLDPKNPPVICETSEKEKALHSKLAALYQAIKETD